MKMISNSKIPITSNMIEVVLRSHPKKLIAMQIQGRTLSELQRRINVRT